MRARAGFTAVEVIVAVTILMGILGAILLAQSSILGLLASTAGSGSLDEKAGRALETLCAEARWAEGASFLITEENGSDRLDLCVPIAWAGDEPVWSDAITYRVEPSSIGADGGRLVRIQDGVKRGLCNYVVPGGFSATRTDDSVSFRIQLAQTLNSTEQPLSSNAQSSISLRN